MSATFDIYVKQERLTIPLLAEAVMDGVTEGTVTDVKALEVAEEMEEGARAIRAEVAARNARP